MTSTTTTRTEKVLVLYGSQTGNSEQAAKDLCNQINTKLSIENIQKLTGKKQDECNIIVKGIHMQLDDFLELHHAEWTRLIIIIVSSYGVGAAPLGAYRFRELCDTWKEEYNNNNNNKDLLNGIYFAMCGLGDSKYTTYFQNPTTIHDTLQLIGAKRIGPLGKADASGTGDNEQLAVIERWMNGICPYLAEVVIQPPLSEETLQNMQNHTIDICKRINPDYKLPSSSKYYSTSNLVMIYTSIGVAFLACSLYFYLLQQQQQ